jgi:hypothetical protein
MLSVLLVNLPCLPTPPLIPAVPCVICLYQADDSAYTVGAVISTTALTAPWLLQEIYATAVLGLFRWQSQGLQRNEALISSLIFSQRHVSSGQHATSLFVLTNHLAVTKSEHHRAENLDCSTLRFLAKRVLRTLSPHTVVFYVVSFTRRGCNFLTWATSFGQNCCMPSID